jgi:hypothetical protein
VNEQRRGAPDVNSDLRGSTSNHGGPLAINRLIQHTASRPGSPRPNHSTHGRSSTPVADFVHHEVERDSTQVQIPRVHPHRVQFKLIDEIADGFRRVAH